MNQTRIIQDFFNAGKEYARVWKSAYSNAIAQTPSALMAAALQEFDAYWTASHHEWTPEDFKELAVSCFIDGFGNFVPNETSKFDDDDDDDDDDLDPLDDVDWNNYEGDYSEFAD